jgi:hypothetical protein
MDMEWYATLLIYNEDKEYKKQVTAMDEAGL